jgi:hypothetical protein
MTTTFLGNPQTDAAGWSVFGNAVFEAAAVRLTSALASQSGAAFYTARSLILDGLTINFTTTYDGSADGGTLFLWDPASGVPSSGMSLTGGGSLAADGIYGSAFRMATYDPGSPGFYWTSHPYPSGQTTQKSEYHPNSYVTGAHAFSLTFTKTAPNTYTVKRIRDGVDLGDWTGCTAPDIVYVGFTAATGGASGNHRVSGVSATGPDVTTVVSGGYGTRAYGAVGYGDSDRTNTDPPPLRTLASTAAGKSTVTFGMSVLSRQGDIVVVPSAPQPQDITLTTPQGPNSLASTPAGAASVSMTMGNRYTVQTRPVGVASPILSLGVTIKPRNQISAGAAGCSKNFLTVILRANSLVIYPSKPPYQSNDVWLATKEGPGAEQGLTLGAVGASTVTMSPGSTTHMAARSDGVAADTFRQTETYAVSSTAAGRATMVDYLGTPIRFTMTSNGIAAYSRNYMATPVRLVINPAGVAGFNRNYLGSPWHVTSTSAGRAGGLAYLSTPQRISFTSAGRAACTKNYLSSPFRVASISAGRATVAAYLGAPFHVTSTAYAQAHVNVYLSSRIYFAGTSPGRAGGSIYMGSPWHVISTSAGRGGGYSYLSGTFLMPNITMRGVAHWSLGPALMFAVPMAGVGHVNDIRTTGTLRIAATSNGVGSMRDNAKLLALVSNGSARGTEMDKPPFAFVVRAGSIWRFQSYYHQYDPRLNPYRKDNEMTGVVIYLSSRVGFANNHPTESHRDGFPPYSGGPSTMAGRSTFTFPYEMVAIANAGCRAFPGYLADGDPALGFPSRPTGPQGVFARQFSPDYMYARTNSFNNGRFTAGAQCYGYLSSKVYLAALAAGRSTVVFLKFGEFEADGIGGFSPTLGAPQRISGVSHGVGGWPTNYLPDRRDMEIRPHGVGHMLGYQHGPVHFEAGLITSHGIGGFSIDPGLLYATSHGVGHMKDIDRPSGVYMKWGSGQFFYEQHFPLIAPLLIPNGSNGMSNVRVEIDHVPIMHHHSNGVGHGSLVPNGIERRASMRADAGSYKHYLPTGHFTDLFGRFDYGVTITAQPVEVVWSPAGVGHMTAHMQVAYILRWMTRGQRFTGDGRDTGGTSGGVGTFDLAGPKALVSISRGRSTERIVMNASARFAANLLPHGLATMIAFTGIPDDRIGNLLRFFFQPMPTGEGQFWPRRTPQPV